MERLGGWGVVLGAVLASGLVGVQLGFIVGDQLAKVWDPFDTLEGRLVVLALGWILLLAWGLWGRNRSLGR